MGVQKTGEELLRAGVTFNFDRADLAPEQGRRVPAVNRARDQQLKTNLDRATAGCFRVLMLPMYSRCEGRQQLFMGASTFGEPRAALVLRRHCAGVALVSILNFF
jgi:hypothetical protein